MAFKCLTCGKECKNNFELLEHEKRRCRKKVCKDCGSKFKQVRDLERHQKNKNKIVCTCCQKTFCTSDHHQQHLRTVWKNENKNIRDLNQQINPSSGYEILYGYDELLEEKDNDIGTKTTTSKFKTIYSIKIDLRITLTKTFEISF